MNAYPWQTENPRMNSLVRCPRCNMLTTPGTDCTWCPPEPLTPYAGTSGWSGSETSHERAVHADSDGTTSQRQQATRRLLAERGPTGLTWRDLARLTGWHHGQASGVLSVLHKEGQVARLAQVRRDRCAVYVLPNHVGGRPVADHGRKRPGLTDAERAAAERLRLRVYDSIMDSDLEMVLDALDRLS